AQVHLGLAAAGDALEERRVEAPLPDRGADPREGGLLRRGRRVRRGVAGRHGRRLAALLLEAAQQAPLGEKLQHGGARAPGPAPGAPGLRGPGAGRPSRASCPRPPPPWGVRPGGPPRPPPPGAFGSSPPPPRRAASRAADTGRTNPRSSSARRASRRSAPEPG